MLQLLVFQWFVLTFLVVCFKGMLKTRGDGLPSHYENDIFNCLLFTLVQKRSVTKLLTGSEYRSNISAVNSCCLASDLHINEPCF